MVVPRGTGAAVEAAHADISVVSGELYCPFVLREHPEAATAQRESMEWALEHGLVKGRQALARLEKARLGQLAGCTFPDAPTELVSLAAVWTTLFCAIDDHVESGHLGTLKLSNYLSELLAAYRKTARAGCDAIERGFSDLGRRIRRLAGPSTAEAFGLELESLFTAYVWEEINRQNDTTLDYEAYRVLRETTIGLRLQFLLSHVACPAGALSRDAAQLLPELERVTCHVVGWANDIFTYEKELAAGETHNLVAVLMRGERLPVREALLRARSIHDEEVCLFLRLQAGLRGSERAGDHIEYRLSHLHDWMRGHLHWALHNGRYRPAAPGALAVTG
jgi:hypothetical protein